MTESNALIKMVEESGLPQSRSQLLLDQFNEYFQIAAEWESKALTIVVTDASQTELIAQARAAWLKLRDRRIALEKTRVELKRDSFNEGKCIDGIANVLKSLLEPPEKHLEKQAKFVEFRQKELDEKRRKEADRLLREKEEAEQKVIDEQAKKDRLENERLKEEADEKDRIHQEELAEIAKEAAVKLKQIEDKAKAVNQKLIDAARVAREKDAAKLQKQKDKAAAEQKKKDDEARIERDRLRAEKEKAEAEKRAAMSNYEKLLKFVREIEAEDFICGHCEGQCSDADSRAADVLQEIGEG